MARRKFAVFWDVGAVYKYIDVSELLHEAHRSSSE
jgi:hypothetical protein